MADSVDAAASASSTDADVKASVRADGGVGWGEAELADSGHELFGGRGEGGALFS